jgi:hypothetical protein
MKSLAFSISIFLTAATVLSACTNAPLSVGHELEVDGGADAVSADGQDSGGSDADAVDGGSNGQDGDTCPSVMPGGNSPCSDLDAGACLYPGQNCGSPGGGPDFDYFCTCTAQGWYCTGGC